MNVSYVQTPFEEIGLGRLADSLGYGAPPVTPLSFMGQDMGLGSDGHWGSGSSLAVS